MNHNKFQKTFFTPDGQTRTWAHVLCFSLATISVFLVTIIFWERMTPRKLPEALFMLFLLTAAWSILFLPIQYTLRQYVLRHAILAKLPYMILPIFMYVVLVLALLIYKKSFSSEDIILFFTDRTRLIFIHFTFFSYLFFSTLLHQFAPAAIPAAKQTITDILDDL